MPYQLKLEGKRALIIDNEIMIALDVERILLDAGFCECTVMRKDEAYRFVPADKYGVDILVIDFRAADDGREDTEKLVAAGTPVILLTTNGDRVAKNWIPAHFRVVEKPFIDEDIVNTLISLLD